MPFECFLDESTWQETNTYLIGVIAIETANMALFETEMGEILEYARHVTGIPNAEIHAQEIFGREGHYQNVDPYERVLIFRKVTDLLVRVAFRICIKPINTTVKLYSADPEHILALAWACEHIEKIADNTWRLTSDHHPQLNGRVTRALAEARRGGTRNCIRFSKLTVDSPVILHSNMSLGLQACDTALYTIGRYLRDQRVGQTGRAAQEIRRLYKAMSNSGILMIKNSWP
ncbi:hypothetical protein [Synechococcus sp. CCY 9618]|uniref:hypothetical protein n=1 Tax=Synechococcus sp. CCY 9618 TaxID=2815602 RepID=UPI001C22DA65|nr:hypothetical protein [Synechococcus sp. CCY 9618]